MIRAAFALLVHIIALPLGLLAWAWPVLSELLKLVVLCGFVYVFVVLMLGA